jgi:thiol-disulfide isomerase/thioredoxin
VNNRRVLAVVALVAGVGLVWAGARYTRWTARFQPVSSDRVKLQFFSNPGVVKPVAMRTLDGRTISSSDWKGKVTIVNFWATWCPPCRAEIPDLVALQEKYRDRLQVIGISEDEGGPEAVQRFAAAYHINYPIVMSTPELLKAFSGVYALPTSFIIDREMHVVQKHVGALNAETTEQETRALVGLSINASIEYVEDNDKVLIRNAAQATKIPGIELEKLSAANRTAILTKLNADNCTCGCGLTLAACRINDPNCGISLPIARKIVDEVVSANTGAAAPPSN